MPRPRGSEYVKDAVQRTGPRGDYVEDFDDLEEEPEFDEEQPPRRRAIQKSKGRRVEESEEEEEEEQEEEDDRRGKQLAVRQGKTKSQSKGKEVVRRKKHDTTEEEDSSDESEKELKKKAKKKTKARKQEVITKKAWEPVPRDEVDRNFIKLVANELGQNPEKILEGIEDDMLQRHMETGEYNIDAFFDTGLFSKKDQKIWKRCVEKLKGNKQKSQILFCSATTKSLDDGWRADYGPNHGPGYGPAHGPGYGPGYGPSIATIRSPGYGPGYGPSGMRTTTTMVLAEPTRGHRTYNPYCPSCAEARMPCHEYFSRYGY
ncbi:MAG: hypothetical protein LQ344_007661 [Seirophora lacunosa]|nr:MAG: hypothetical protein LQ344_007661 [Seirophora lacunosa]